jgi:hypothetical protein
MKFCQISKKEKIMTCLVHHSLIMGLIGRILLMDLNLMTCLAISLTE